MADSRFAPSQWETSLQSNAVSHWLGANLELALEMYLHSLSFLDSEAAKIIETPHQERWGPVHGWIIMDVITYTYPNLTETM